MYLATLTCIMKADGSSRRQNPLYSISKNRSLPIMPEICRIESKLRLLASYFFNTTSYIIRLKNHQINLSLIEKFSHPINQSTSITHYYFRIHSLKANPTPNRNPHQKLLRKKKRTIQNIDFERTRDLHVIITSVCLRARGSPCALMSNGELLRAHRMMVPRLCS